MRLLPMKHLYLSSFSSCTACPFGFTFLSNANYVTQDVLLWKELHIQEIFCETFFNMCMTSVFKKNTLYVSTLFNIVQSCHMHRSTVH
jgi:hypothetical protein